ncbi:unnamed protein product, partial [Iphiclides podalirius]
MSNKAAAPKGLICIKSELTPHSERAQRIDLFYSPEIRFAAPPLRRINRSLIMSSDNSRLGAVKAGRLASLYLLMQRSQ